MENYMSCYYKCGTFSFADFANEYGDDVFMNFISNADEDTDVKLADYGGPTEYADVDVEGLECRSDVHYLANLDFEARLIQVSAYAEETDEIYPTMGMAIDGYIADCIRQHEEAKYQRMEEMSLGW